MKKLFTLLFFLSSFYLLAFVQSVKAETYTYTATNFQTMSWCPLGAEFDRFGLTSPTSADAIKIVGTGFGINGDKIYLPTSEGVFWTNGDISTTDPGYLGYTSWSNNEINLKIRQGLGSSLGSYIILRPANSDGSNCIRGNLTAGLVCTSFTYSDWSTCQSNSTKTRIATNSSPNGCSGGDPVLTQSCSYIPACAVNDYSCGDWSSCSVSGNQTRTCNKTSGCDGGVQMPTTSQSCAYSRPSCISFTYSDWGECKKVYGRGDSDGYQNRDVIAKYPADCQGGSTNIDSAIPQTTQACTYTPPIPSCIEADWLCANWETCSQNSSQTRTCAKNSNCQGGVSSPATSQSCTYVAPVPSCISFNYSVWSECSSNGSQTRNITSKYPYNCEGGESPKTAQSCTYIPTCTADTWTCDSWGSCSLSGIQNRSCRKIFDCPNVETAPPTTDQYCEAPSRPAQQIPQNSSDEISNQDIIIKSTVKLLCPVDTQKASQGSGTIINSNGTILTNKHVIVGTLGCLVGFINDFNDEPYFGERQIADIIKVSSNQDIAILKMRNPQNKTLPNVDITRGSGNPRLGAKVTTYGFPAKFGTKVTYTSGDFSGTDGAYIKTTAILEYGNSGGGAYLKDGTFIGIPSAVVRGELNALGYILAINTINAWLGNSSIVFGGTSNNQYSRVSVLEDIDLKTLDSLRLFIPDIDARGNLVAPTKNNNAQKTTEQPKINQTQKESTVIESTDTNQKINPGQNSQTPSEKKSTEEKGNDSSINLSEQRRSTVANAVQEMVKVAERSGGVGQEIKTIAQTQTKNQEELETGLQKIQNRGGFARFFIGPNYGEIKESQKLLKQNKEQIQELNKLRAQITGQKDQQQIVEQVQLLGQVTQQIENTLNEAQNGFSLFGWMFRLFAK